MCCFANGTLETLILKNIEKTNELFYCLENLKKLSTLRLNEMEISKKAIDSIINYQKNLKVLLLHESDISNFPLSIIDKFFQNLYQIEVLDLSLNTDISDDFLKFTSSYIVKT